MPSFDGSKLDVDLTLPRNDSGSGRHPLIVMLHGFGNNKHEFESIDDRGDDRDKYHWNNHWFAEHGYYVLNYTARGFRDDGKYDAYQPDTPGTPFTSVDLDSPNSSGTLHVKSRDFEIKDTQYLAALTAKAFPKVDPTQIAVTGTSYGGGESWTQASQGPHWTWPQRFDPTLPALELQVAVPHWPWTDLSYALSPNGHGGGPSGKDIYESSQGQPNSDKALATRSAMPSSATSPGCSRAATSRASSSGARRSTPAPRGQSTSRAGSSGSTARRRRTRPASRRSRP